jgi:hypothetical protein
MGRLSCLKFEREAAEDRSISNIMEAMRQRNLREGIFPIAPDEALSPAQVSPLPRPDFCPSGH